MEILEIVLILLGIVVFVGSFLLPAGRNVESLESAKIIEESVREMVGKEVDGVRSKISDMVNETISYSVEKTERSMERLTNEKMLAVNEYSDTVMEEINKNHQEVVFLYDMLNNKHESLTAAVGEAARVAGDVKQTVQDAEIMARETEDKVRQAKDSMDETLGAVERMQDRVSGFIEEAKMQPVAEPLALPPAPDPEEANFKPIMADGLEVVSPLMQEDFREEVSFPYTEVMPFREENDERDNIAPVAAEGMAENGRNNNEKILSLHKTGRSNVAIARELGLGVGEVKLVIDLYEGDQGIRVKDDELKILS